MYDYWSLIFSYAIIGGGLKYIDQVYDVGVFDKKGAIFFTIICSLLMGSLIAFDPGSAALLLGITVGVGITGKLDVLPFKIVAVVSAAFPLFLMLNPFVQNYEFHMDWILFAVISILAAIDEKVNDWKDARLKKIIEVRPVLEIGVLVLGLLNVFSLIYFVYLMIFDICYMSVNWYSGKSRRTWKY